MAFVLQSTASEAFPIIERNTFISVYCGESALPTRRCSSLPAQMRRREDALECGAKLKGKTPDGVDSEAITDVCTESSFSDCGNTTEEGEQSPLSELAKDDDEHLSMLRAALPSAKTRLSSKAALWAPAADSFTPMAEVAPLGQWRVAVPQDPEWLRQWQESAASIVWNMSIVIGQLECVSCVDCHRDASTTAWTVSVRCSAAGFDGVQAAAQESICKDVQRCQCLYLLGYRRAPFQPIPAGFVAVLASMVNTKNACWDYYTKGFCPRGCACQWEHPGLGEQVNVLFDFSESTPVA